jgi:hypothetical protein
MGLAGSALGCVTSDIVGTGHDGSLTVAQGDSASTLQVGEARIIARRVNPLSSASRGAARKGALRLDLPRGRFLVCFHRGDDDSGHRLMAQAWGADGSPLGAPVQISPPGVDVASPPEAAALSGGEVVVTFPAYAEGQFSLYAVHLTVL